MIFSDRIDQRNDHHCNNNNVSTVIYRVSAIDSGIALDAVASGLRSPSGQEVRQKLFLVQEAAHVLCIFWKSRFTIMFGNNVHAPLSFHSRQEKGWNIKITKPLKLAHMYYS